MTTPRFPRFTRAEVIFSGKCFAAAMLALYVASAVGLTRPFWAVLTTYVVAHPLSSHVRSKALFRFGGTLTGCVFTLLTVPALSNAPEVLTLTLAMWVGLCLYLSLLDRTARSYGFMLAGYTAALIGFPSVEVPTLLFETAAARVEEVSLGIVCATAIHSIVFPQSLGPTLLGLLHRSLGDARRWFDDAVAGANNRQGQAGVSTTQTNRLTADRQRLAGDITQLRLLATHVPFDVSNFRQSASALRNMQGHIAALTPVLSSVEDQLFALAEVEGGLAPDLAEALERTRRWLKDKEAAEDGAANETSYLQLHAWLAGLGASVPNNDGTPSAFPPPESEWGSALRVSLAVRLQELLTGWRACIDLRQALTADLSGDGAPRHKRGPVKGGALHRDPGMATLSAFAAVAAICLASAFWIATAWPSGSTTALSAAIFCSFYATMDDPASGIDSFLRMTVLSMPLSALYLLVLLPLVHDFGMLVFLCAPTFIIIGCLAARPSTAPAAIALVFGVGGTLALRDTGNDDLVAFLNTNLAQAVGILVAGLVTRAVRTVGADWAAARLRRATWKELGEMAHSRNAQPANAAHASRTLDRISLLVPRIAVATTDVPLEAGRSILRDLRIGADISSLQGLGNVLPRATVGELMAVIAKFYRVGSGPGDKTVSPSFRPRLDQLLRAALGDRMAGEEDRRTAVASLVGLRRNLFPDAPTVLDPFVQGAQT